MKQASSSRTPATKKRKLTMDLGLARLRSPVRQGVRRGGCRGEHCVCGLWGIRIRRETTTRDARFRPNQTDQPCRWREGGTSRRGVRGLPGPQTYPCSPPRIDSLARTPVPTEPESGPLSQIPRAEVYAIQMPANARK
jgi:hypothetical protein